MRFMRPWREMALIQLALCFLQFSALLHDHGSDKLQAGQVEITPTSWLKLIGNLSTFVRMNSSQNWPDTFAWICLP